MKRITTREGLVYYRSDLLDRIGVPHAFSTRIGGVSQGAFASLNLGNPSGSSQDDWGNIYENYRLLQTAIGCENLTRCWVHQVHAGDVAWVENGFESGVKADAMVTCDPSRLLAVRIADCVPILLSDAQGRSVAAIHAGWRGVVAGVVGNTVRRMNAQPSAISAAIGPCIGFDAFEVGPEVLAEFERVFGDDAPVRRCDNDKGRVDLRRAVAMQLAQSGLPPDRIDVTDRCTSRDGDEFFSHRRDNGVTGRMAALIAPVRQGSVQSR